MYYEVEIKADVQTDQPDKSVTRNSTLFTIFYRNITRLLPRRSTMRLDEIETEYEILNDTAAIWISPAQPLLVSVLFHHPSLDTSMPAHGRKLACASSEVASGGDAWQVELCNTIILQTTSTRCSCTAPGTVALLLFIDPDSPYSKPVRPLPYAVIAGCMLCLLLCLVSTAYLTGRWIAQPSCLVFLKFQSSLCGVTSMALFIGAVLIEPLKDTYMIFNSALACALLLGLSSHLSTLLVIWTEIIPFSGMVSRPSVAAISTGLPILAVFGNFLAHRTMDLEPTFWWLQYNTLAFGIIALSALLICSLFTPLHVVLFIKISKIRQLRDNNIKLIKKRSGLLQRSACLFAVHMIMAVSSVLFTNHIDDMWPQYLFCFCAVSLGVVKLICYCLLPEAKCKPLTKENCKQAENKQFFSTDTSSPLNFFTKQEGENESESIPIQVQGPFSLPDDQKYTGELKQTTTFCTVKELSVQQSEHPLYQANVQTAPKITTLERLSPDILGDLVESKTGDCERSQPDGREKDKLDGMLDSITHDLDYLLNRAEASEESTIQCCSTEKVSKTPSRCFPARTMDLIQEEPEEDIKLPDSITDILRTSC